MSRRQNIVIDSSAPEWAQRLQVDLNRVLDAINRDVAFAAVPSVALADLPDDGSRQVAVVSDAVGGPKLAFFDGAAWRRADDLTVVV